MELLKNEALYDALIERGMKAVRRSLWIATADAKNFRVRSEAGGVAPVTDLLLDLARRGVKVRLLHAAIPTGPFRDALKTFPPDIAGSGFQMRRCPRLHFKAILFDHRRLYLGSANLTGAAMGIRSEKTRNFEMGILTEDETFMDAVAEQFNALWEGAECQTCALKGKECPVPLEGPFD